MHTKIIDYREKTTISLEALIDALGVTQTAFADRVGVTKKYISKIIRNRGSASKKLINTIHIVYGVDIRSLSDEQIEQLKAQTIENAKANKALEETLPARIKTYRENLGLSIKGFSYALGYSGWRNICIAEAGGDIYAVNGTIKRINRTFGIDFVSLSAEELNNPPKELKTKALAAAIADCVLKINKNVLMAARIMYVRQNYCHWLPRTYFADKLGVSAEFISQIEAGEISPPDHLIENINNVFQINLDSIQISDKECKELLEQLKARAIETLTVGVTESAEDSLRNKKSEPMSAAEKIKLVRKKLQLSQNKFADKLGLKVSGYIAQVESGMCLASMKLMENILNIWQIDVTSANEQFYEQLEQLKPEVKEKRASTELELLAEKIKFVREKLGLSRDDFAKLLGYIYPTTRNMVKKINDTFKVDFATLSAEKLDELIEQLKPKAIEIIKENQALQELLAKRIKMVRESLGLSRKDFADKLGTSVSHIDHLESGEWPISKESIEKLLDIFGVDITVPDEQFEQLIARTHETAYKDQAFPGNMPVRCAGIIPAALVLP